MDGLHDPRARSLSTSSEACQDVEQWLAVGGAAKRRGLTSRSVSYGKDSGSIFSVASDASATELEGWQPRQRAVTAPASAELNESLVAENESLGERIVELEEQNRMLRLATRDLEDLRAQVAQQDALDPAKSQRLSKRRSLAEMEVDLRCETERREQAERLAKAEEDTIQELQQQLRDSQARQQTSQEELGRLRALLLEAQQKGSASLAELSSTKTSLQEAQATLQHEQLVLSQERDHVRKLEEELDMQAGQNMRGRKSRAERRLVTYNLLSQLNLDDEDGSGSEVEGDTAEQNDEEEDKNGRLEALKEQLDAACKEKEDALAEAKALKERLAGACREKEEALAEAKAQQQQQPSVAGQQQAAAPAEAEATVVELQKQLLAAQGAREEAEREAEATAAELQKQLLAAQGAREEAARKAEAMEAELQKQLLAVQGAREEDAKVAEAATAELQKQLRAAHGAREEAAQEAEAAAAELRRQLLAAQGAQEEAVREAEATAAELRRQLLAAQGAQQEAVREAEAAVVEMRKELLAVRGAGKETAREAEAARASAARAREALEGGAARDAALAELQQRVVQLQRAVEQEQKTNKDLRAELGSSWWSRLTCLAPRPQPPEARPVDFGKT